MAKALPVASSSFSSSSSPSQRRNQSPSFGGSGGGGGGGGGGFGASICGGTFGGKRGREEEGGEGMTLMEYFGVSQRSLVSDRGELYEFPQECMGLSGVGLQVCIAFKGVKIIMTSQFLTLLLFLSSRLSFSQPLPDQNPESFFCNSHSILDFTREDSDNNLTSSQGPPSPHSPHLPHSPSTYSWRRETFSQFEDRSANDGVGVDEFCIFICFFIYLFIYIYIFLSFLSFFFFFFMLFDFLIPSLVFFLFSSLFYMMIKKSQGRF